MKKRLMMVAVLLGALTLGACVDDNESASVTKVREAKAEQLQALAEQAKLEGEARKIEAEAQKAYNEAYAKYLEAQAGEKEALTKEVLQRIEQSKIKFEAELETIKAEYEARLQEAKRDAIAAEQAALDKVETRLQALYLAYSSASSELLDKKKSKALLEYDLVGYNAGVASVDEVILTKKSQKERAIKEKEAKIKAWETYEGLDKAKLEAELEALKQAKYKTFADWDAAQTKCGMAEEASDKALAIYDYSYEGVSTVKVVAALQEFINLSTYKRGILLGYFNNKEEAYQYYLQEVTAGNIEPRYGDKDRIYNGWYMNNPSMGDMNSGYYYLGGYINIAGKNYDPINISNSVEVSKVPSVYVPFYQLNSNYDATVLTQEFAKDKKLQIEYLGVEAAGSEPATGYYGDLARAEKQLSDAQGLQTELNAANDLVKVAQKKVDETQKPIDALNAENSKAQEAINKANRDKSNAQTEKSVAEQEKTDAGSDAAKVAAAQAKIDAAVKTIKAADDLIVAKNKVITDNNAKIADLQLVNDVANREFGYAYAEQSVVTGKITTFISNYPSTDNVYNIIKAIEKSEQYIAQWKDAILNAKDRIENSDKLQAAWLAVVDELSGSKLAAYEKELKGLAANEAVAAYIKAAIAEEDAHSAYTEADELLTAASNAISGEEVKDAAKKIEQLNEDIATLKKEIVELQTEYILVTDRYGNVTNTSASALAKIIAETKAEIEKLDGEITIQETIVKLAKANLDKAIAAATPAE